MKLANIEQINTVLPRLWGNRHSCVFPGENVNFLDFPEDTLVIYTSK